MYKKTLELLNIIPIIGLLFTALILPINALASSTSQRTIIVGYFSLPPHVIVGEGDAKPTGAAIEYFEQEIAPRLKVQVKWIRQPLTRSIKSMQEGEIDAVISLGKNEQRAKVLIYPQQPYHYIRSGMLVLNEDSLDEIASVESIADRKILIINGWLQSPFIVKHKQSLDLQYIYGDNTARRLSLMLLRKRFSMVYSPVVSTILYHLKAMGKSERVKVLSLPGESAHSSGLYSVFSPKNAQGLAADYDKVSANISPSSVSIYQAYLAKYIN
jgi:ABC-type amino acid transport substrate-binding protein